MLTPSPQRRPITEAALRRDLVRIGIESGMTVVVHSSLSSLGWVVGGPPTVVRALLGAIGERGTLAMPAATPHCADPASWSAPEIPPRWLEEVRAALPLFERRTTPTAMGAIAETFRTWPGTLRSDHPLESVCARGPGAEEITGEHPLAFSEGEGSPFAKLHALDSRVLLLGVGFNRCMALHFAESLMENRRTMTVRFPRLEEGVRTWVEVPNVADDNDRLFPQVGELFLAAGKTATGAVGESRSILFPMRDLVRFARRYFDSVLYCQVLGDSSATRNL